MDHHLIVQADARALPFPDGIAQCCVTSPPYWGLRDYGIEGQLGHEDTPDAYVRQIVSVFDEVWRVLSSDGVAWLNLGDSYAHSLRQSPNKSGDKQNTNRGSIRRGFAPIAVGLKEKDLVGIPWRCAFALQARGWLLRSDIVWAKPNPMPESVTDRPTRAHEYLFMLTKQSKYYYNADAIKEPYAASTLKETRDGYDGQATKDYDAAGAQNPSDTKRRIIESVEKGTGRNKRTVWMITPQPFRGAHFATFPEKLVEPCVLASSRPGDFVLDPFAGSGTVGVVALKHERYFLGTELNADYIHLANRRIRGERERAESEQ